MNTNPSAPTSTVAPAPGVAASLSRLHLLRWVLRFDAFTLALLGALFMFAPRQVQAAFHFENLPSSADYLIGLWGCALATMAVGYVLAAQNPFRNVVWVQIGIARGLLECLFGGFYLAQGAVTWQQAGFGLVLAAGFTLVYIALYPRRTDIVRVAFAKSVPVGSEIRQPEA